MAKVTRRAKRKDSAQELFHEKSTTPCEPADAIVPFAEDEELMGDFLLEAREHLTSVESHMLTLERNPLHADSIHAVFRAFHSIKGLAGFLDLEGIRTFTHDVETLLDEVRNSRLEVNPEIIDVVLKASDRVNVSLRALDEGVRDRSDARLAADRVLLKRIRDILKTSREPLLQDREAPPEIGPGEDTSSGGQLTAELRTVKVDLAKLDYLVEMIGETVIASSLVKHDPELSSGNNPRLQRNLAQMNRLVREVQQITMGLRMVPIRQLFQKTARIARDLSRKGGKPIDFVVKGDETELDRNIIEELADPLMHMVRNSIDHGIEDPTTRAAAGKAAIAKLELRAAHQSGYILVEIADDGRGLDEDLIVQRAAEKGLIDTRSKLSHEQILNLIFLPGFSTATGVSDISGRGVGMDVVRRHIQKLHGRIEIDSVKGAGARFSLKLPLTLAIIDGLVVRVKEQRYIVPAISARELFKPVDGAVMTVQGRGEMALVRDRLLPLIRLEQQFQLGGVLLNPCEGLLIVIEAEDNQYCLLVDELLGRQEVVIKTLGEAFKGTPGISGGAILGDGRVGLILDVATISTFAVRRINAA